MSALVLAFTNEAAKRDDPLIRKVMLLAEVHPVAAEFIEKLVGDLLAEMGYSPDDVKKVRRRHSRNGRA